MSNVTASAPATVVVPTNADAAVNVLKYTERAVTTWAQYVADNGVTTDTVLAHAKALAALAFPGDQSQVGPSTKNAEGKRVQGPRTRVGRAVDTARAGMTYALGAEKGASKSSDALLTSKGAAATLAEVTAAWHAAQK